MASWVIKAVTQKFISFLPYRHKINYLFQRYVTKGLVLTDQLFESKLLHCRQHIDAWKKYGGNQPLVTLELGTGWHPVVPVGLFLHGAEKMYTADIESLLTMDRTQQVLGKFVAWHKKGLLADRIGSYDIKKIEVLEELLATDNDLHHILARLHIHTIVGDLTAKQEEINADITLIHSNNTLEHVSEAALQKLLVFFRQIISTHGIMSHFIDMSDHFSHLDKKITPFHFLQFSDKAWRIIDNGIQPQNRFRISDYRRFFETYGWRLLEEENISGKASDLNNIRLASKFVNYAEADNLVTHSHVITMPDHGKP